MKLGAIPKTEPLVDDGESIVVGPIGTAGVGDAINAAAGVAGNISAAPGPVAGSLVQTEQGPVFQPNPTTVTVVPPARTIQIMPGEGEALQADEELGIPQGQQAQQAQPMQQPMQQGQPMQQPMYPPQPYYQSPYPMQQPYYNLSPYPQQPPMNMSSAPAIYAASAPQPAQIYSSGVPGAPPTIAIPTDQSTMSQFSLPAGPKPKKSFTLRKNRAPGQAGGFEEDSGSNSNSSIVVTVSKMS
ncbi:hypothetical protein EBX93_16795 [bacterium]|nr:hypothetical protein [bacterium]